MLTFIRSGRRPGGLGGQAHREPHVHSSAAGSASRTCIVAARRPDRHKLGERARSKTQAVQEQGPEDRSQKPDACALPFTPVQETLFQGFAPCDRSRPTYRFGQSIDLSIISFGIGYQDLRHLLEVFGIRVVIFEYFFFNHCIFCLECEL
jgi:hypothetical protein